MNWSDWETMNIFNRTISYVFGAIKNIFLLKKSIILKIVLPLA